MLELMDPRLENLGRSCISLVRKALPDIQSTIRFKLGNANAVFSKNFIVNNIPRINFSKPLASLSLKTYWKGKEITKRQDFTSCTSLSPNCVQ